MATKQTMVMEQVDEVVAGGSVAATIAEATTPACPVTMTEHQKIVDAVRARALAIPADDVQKPSMPVPIFIDEGHIVVQAAEICFPELAAAGMKREPVTELAFLLRCLASAQALWSYQRLQIRPPELEARVRHGEEVLADSMARAELAYAGTPAEPRVHAVRIGEGDLPSRLVDLALVISENPEPVRELGIDADALGRKLGEVAEDARKASAELDALSLSVDGREIRDRIYTLALEPLTKIRAFAQFTYRTAAEQKKRAKFTSAYLRTRNRRHYQKRRDAAEAAEASSEVPGAEGLDIAIDEAA